jgi:hypothetical protein
MSSKKNVSVMCQKYYSFLMIQSLPDFTLIPIETTRSWFVKSTEVGPCGENFNVLLLFDFQASEDFK